MKKTKKQNIILETLGRLFFILPKFPRTVQIEVTNRCNLDCKMCPRKFLGVEYKDMEFELFKKVVDRLEGISEITLTGWGEPLIHPQISAMIAYVHQTDQKVKLTTNATLLNNPKADQIIKAGLDEITFSIESIQSSDNIWGHLNTVQIENIKKFAARAKRPKIILQVTIHKNQEKDIFDIIKFAQTIKAERVNLARLDTRFNKELKRPKFQEEKLITLKAIKLGDKLGISVDSIYHSLNKGFKRYLFRIIKNFLHLRGKYCLKIYNTIYINLKGEVTPCCALPLYKIDSLLEKDLKTIWLSKKFTLFRKNQKKICGDCDVGQIKQISK